MQGMPVGNGDMGLLLWTEGSRVVAQINKVDLFEDSPDYGDGMVDVEYGHEPHGCHGARVSLDFGMPIFDLLYLKRCDGRIDLPNAEARLASETEFGRAKVSAFGSRKEQVIFLEYEAEAQEEFQVVTGLERYGSRPFSSWYDTWSRGNAEQGLAGTETEILENTLVIYQQLQDMQFVVCARQLPGTPQRMNRHGGRITAEPGKTQKGVLVLTIVTSENAPDPLAAAQEILDRVEAKGVDAIRREHREEWKEFWKKSFLQIGNPYLEATWHLNLYYANSSCHGDYPARFVNGIWGWNRDVANWAYYFHWNTQNYIWPLHAANHAELSLPYYRYRYRSLDNAKIYAKNQQGHEGAFYADVADRKGRNVGRHWDNQTPGAQIALLFWKHWLYTQDTEFLKNRAWPVLRETARYYASLVEKGEDGVYRSPCSQSLEGSPLFAESLTDTSMIMALLPTAARCAELLGEDSEETSFWKDIVAHINPLYTVPLEEGEYEEDADGRRVFTCGLGRGKELQAGEVFATGKFLAGGHGKLEDLPSYIREPLSEMSVTPGQLLRHRYGIPGHPTYYGTPDAEFTPIFPAQLVGIKDRGSFLYKVSVDQAHLHPRSIPKSYRPVTAMAGSVDSQDTVPEIDHQMCMGWCPYPVILARLGLVEEAEEALKNVISSWQFYPQGFGHYGPHETFITDRDNRWKLNNIKDLKTGEIGVSPSWPFRHFTFEAVPIVCTAMNEMLLQSHEGFIRLLAAAPADWSGSFELAAEGGFLVNAEYDQANLEWAAIESRCGGRCRLVRPWADQKVRITAIAENGDMLGPVPFASTLDGTDRLCEWETQKGVLYIITTEDDDPSQWIVEEASFTKNQEARYLGEVQLGLPRMF